MTDGSVAWSGLAVQLLVAAGYFAAASRRSPRGTHWPLIRTAAFVSGLLVIAIALDSPLAAHDDVPSIHVLQHGLLMMLAPMLLALGAPMTLAMRTMSAPGRRRLRAVLHDPSIRGLIARPAVLVADYNVTMALMLGAPINRLAEQHLAIHIAAHAYLVACGFLFWSAMLARDPVPGRLPAAVRRRAVLIGNPINLGLAAALVFAAGAFAAAQMLLAVTAITSVLGASLIGAHTPRQVRPIRVVVDA